MNDNTEALIRELAEKMGTTAEHLWGVLVRQAPITGTINLLVIAACVFAVVWAFRFLKAKTTTPKPTDNDRFPIPEWEDAEHVWVIWGLVAVFVAFLFGLELSNAISAIINPEYWALKQLLP